jgi:hypothetical protein
VNGNAHSSPAITYVRGRRNSLASSTRITAPPPDPSWWWSRP